MTDTSVLSGARWRRLTRLVLSFLSVLIGFLVFAGYDLAQVRTGLEKPSPEAIARANEASLRAHRVATIDSYDRFVVDSNDTVRISVYARESESAAANVLLVHGAGSGAWAWEFYFRSLPDDYNLYAMSWRGHFDSTPVRDANSDDFILDQEAVAQAIAERNHLPIHLVGHSYGAATAVLQVAERDDRFASLTLIAPVVPIDYTATQSFLLPLVAPWFIEQENDPDGAYGSMFISERRMRHYYREYAGKSFSEENSRLISGDGVSPKWQRRLESAYKRVADLKLPVMMMIARYDNVVSPERQTRTGAQIGFEPTMLQSGHYIPLDIRSDTSSAVLSSFLSGMTQRSAFSP